MTIDERNRLRKEVGLPLLDLNAECARLNTVQRDAAFEQYYRENRCRFASLWADRGRGWLSNAGIWVAARRQLRAEFEAH
jgi:tRNA(Met) C34 N-acetyltransferase TmcA